MTEAARMMLRGLPSVDAVLQLPEAVSLVQSSGHTVVSNAVRAAIDGLRAALLGGVELNPAVLEAPAVLVHAVSLMNALQRSGMKRVVNATGIILHTGLGRAAMPAAVRQPLVEAAGYCNVQMELETGRRVRRESNILALVRELTGAEDAVLVNNNAGATLLVLRALARGREVVISRGELIEIGGSFRLPDIMEESGAVLREIGTTNKTHPADYENAITPATALLLKAHKSNFSVVGFTADVGIDVIAGLGKKHNVPVVDDIGCGALVPLEKYGLPHEVTVRESIDAGADIVLFSTDKLIGGPQGGLIVGRRALIDKIRRQPLYRVLRVCKLTLAALEATLKLFRAPELLEQRHPVYRMLAKPLPEIEGQAAGLASRIAARRPEWDVSIVSTVSYLGGGSLPGSELPSFAVRIASAGTPAEAVARMFRQADVPVVAHIKDDAVLLDMRTVQDDECHFIIEALK